MALTATQEIPMKPVPKQPWSTRALFPARALAKTLGAIFITPFDILLGLLVIAIVVVELAGHTSWGLYVFSTLVLGADVYERHNKKVEPDKPSKEEKVK